MALLKKGVLHLDGGARIPFHTRSRGKLPECSAFSAPKWSISPIDSVISDFFQRSHGLYHQVRGSFTVTDRRPKLSQAHSDIAGGWLRIDWEGV